MIRMKWTIFAIVFTASTLAFSQDERFFQDMLNGSAVKEKKLMEFKIEVQSPFYVMDLNQDGIEDSFQIIKRDGIDYFRVNDPFGEMKYEYKFDAKGVKGRILKAHFKQITPKVTVLVLYYYEGQTGTTQYESSARLYFATIRDGSLDKISMTKGPYFFFEKLDSADKYLLRTMSVNLVDYNKDGMSEISVTYNKIQRIYFYNGTGLWKKL